MITGRKSKNLKKPLLALLTVFILILGYAGFRIWKYISIGAHVIIPTNEIKLKQTEEKNVNILLLGVGGGTHEGPELTDTIIFASLNPKAKKVLLASVPRDLWVPDISAKINAAYVYGEEKGKGKGLLAAKEMTGKVLGEQIDYAVKIDFDGFVKAVDMIGGLDVNVENTFDDYAYPVTGKEDESCGHTDEEIASISAELSSPTATISALEAFPCRFEHLHFDAGNTNMDGITALKFVRSRHALGPEGSDFARSKRQAKIISAFKEKIFSMNVLLNPAKVLDLVNVVKDNIVTDIREDEYADFIKLAQKMQGASIKSAVLDTGDETSGRTGLLINPPTGPEYSNAWVLIPADGNGDFSKIHKYIDCEIKNNCISPTPAVK